MKTIYLAGKCQGPKWKVVDQLNSPVRFVSSDGEYINDFGNHCTCCHEHDICMNNGEEVVKDFLDKIKSSDFMIAYIDNDNSYGTVAEIAAASMLGKKIFLLINKEVNPEDDFHDAYWFVSNFPGVIRIDINFEKAREIIRNLIVLESPIEELFYYQYLESYNWYDEKENILIAQYGIGGYRVDFVVKGKKIIIELDGHEFHKTKEQREYDCKRERFLQKEGWQIIRYTGTEIYKNSKKCVDDVFQMLPNLPKSELKNETHPEIGTSACEYLFSS